MSDTISKKFGGQDRANKARVAMSKIFSDTEHPLYLEKDIDLAKKFDVSRLTIYNIREQLKVLSRTDRIVSKLRSINTELFTKKELADKLRLKYQNLYKIIREYGICVKPDTPPIVSMIKYQREKTTSQEAPLKKAVPKKSTPKPKKPKKKG